MWYALLFFQIFFANASDAPSTDPVELGPTVIEDAPLDGFFPRSVLWPSVQEPLPDRKLSPDLADTLNSTGQLQVRTQGSPTISLRGSGQSGRVLSLFNNVPLNFSTGFGTPTILLPKEIVGDLNIIKGPSSLFYGSQAMGGSVHFVPRWASSPEVHLSLSDTDESFLPWRKGSLASHSVTLIAPLRTPSKSLRQVSFFTENDDGVFPYTENASQGLRTNNQSQLNRGTLIGKEHFEKWDLSYDLIAGNQIATSPGSTNFSQQTLQKTTGLLGSLSPSFQLGSNSRLKTRSNYIDVKSTFEESGTPSLFHQKTFIQQTDYQFNASRWKVKIFGDYFAHSLQSSFYPEDLSEDSFEAGPLLTVFVNPEISLQAGTRYLFRNERSLSNVGVFYSPNPSSLWLQYSEGFRRASLSDKFATTPFSVANPNLSPETSEQIEFGYKYAKKKAPVTTYQLLVSGEFRTYLTRYKDFFETRSASLTQVQKVNQGKGEASGIDTKLNLSWGPWVLDLNYNYLKTKNQALRDEAFRLSPEQQWSGNLTHFVGPFGFRLQNVVWQKTFDRDLTGQLQALPNWSQWNIEFFSYAFQRTNFNIGVNNVFAESKQLTLFYPEPERRYWAQLRFSL